MIRIVTGLLLLMSAAALAGGGWRLASTGAGYQLKSGEHVVATFDSVATFGEASGKIAVLGYRNRALALYVVDEKTHQVESSWPLDLLPVSQMAGPTRDIALVDGYAYFPSVRAGAERRSIAQNLAQGQFDLSRVALVNGELEQFALPPETDNPRTMQAGNQIYVHLGRGANVVFDAEKKICVQVDAAEIARLGLSPAIEPALTARPDIPITVRD